MSASPDLKRGRNYDVTIIRIADGEERTWGGLADDHGNRDATWLTWDEGNEFWWTDGNFGCDCNRYLEFERAGGNQPDMNLVNCGRGAFRIRVTDMAGKVLFEEGTLFEDGTA